MNDSTTYLLVQHCLDGDEAAIETLIHTYQHLVYRLAYSILNDAAEADEAAQDTFVSALSALRSYQVTRPDAEHPETTVVAREADEAVRKAVHALDEKLQLPVILRYEHELPIAEIAQVLRVSERTVHTRLRAAHDQLRHTLNGQMDCR